MITPIGPQCIICLQSEDTITYNGECNCKPIIHIKCLDEWFKVNSQTCPICRKVYTSTYYTNNVDDPTAGCCCCCCIFTFIAVMACILFI